MVFLLPLGLESLSVSPLCQSRSHSSGKVRICSKLLKKVTSREATVQQHTSKLVSSVFL